jgi:hypothetical protein
MVGLNPPFHFSTMSARRGHGASQAANLPTGLAEPATEDRRRSAPSWAPNPTLLKSIEAESRSGLRKGGAAEGSRRPLPSRSQGHRVWCGGLSASDGVARAARIVGFGWASTLRVMAFFTAWLGRYAPQAVRAGGGCRSCRGPGPWTWRIRSPQAGASSLRVPSWSRGGGETAVKK